MSRYRSATMMVVGVAVAMFSQNASAQFPNWKARPVHPRIDVIPPLGNHLPLSYRARMNRPTYLGGRLAYTFEPTSQEAMAWQKAWERGYYADHAPRMETHYIYPKAWEVLGIGPRPKRDGASGGTTRGNDPLTPLGGGDDQWNETQQPESLAIPPAEPEGPNAQAAPSVQDRLPAGLNPADRGDSPLRLDGAAPLDLSPAAR